MRKRIKNFEKYLPIILLLFTAFRILAGMRIPYLFLSDQRYDDRMLFDNASDLLSGVWLGDYDSYTLAKGIGYPIFLVLARKLFLPYSVLLALLQAAGAWLFVQALSVRMQNPYLRAFLYLLLLYSPINLTLFVTQRIYRMSIVPGMVLLVFSGMIGLTLRKDRPLKSQLPWALATGVSLAFFWQIREDSIWILPFIAIMTIWNVGSVIAVMHKNKTVKQMLLHCVALLLPVLLLVTGNCGLAAINASHYGVFMTNDRTEGSFADLMSLFYRLESPTEVSSDIWISRSTIAQAEAASPTLCKLQPLLDNYVINWSSMDGEIPGDHFSWVLRGAVQDSGYAPDAVSAQNFYRAVYEELQSAISTGELTLNRNGAIYFSSQSKGILPSEIPGILSDTLKNVWEIAGYTECALNSSAKSTGHPTDIRRMEAFTSCLGVYPTLSGRLADEYDSVTDETLYDTNEFYSQSTVSLLNKSNAVYQFLGQPVFLLALIVFCVLTCRVIYGLFHKDTMDPELWILSCGILLSAVLLRFGCSMFTAWFTEDMQKFINSFYSCGVYILLQMFKYLVIYAAAENLNRFWSGHTTAKHEKTFQVHSK